jgi:membrane-associated phospholipid phosphatase
MLSCRRLQLITVCVVGFAATHISSVSLPAQAPESRAALIARAQVWTRTDIPRMDVRRGPAGVDAFAPGATVRCDYLDRDLDGNSPKFQCRMSGPAKAGPDDDPGKAGPHDKPADAGAHDDIKVKFGVNNGEVYGEVAASRLLWTLGFGADRMYPVRVICRGCPEDVGGELLPDGSRLIDPAVVERRNVAAEPPVGVESAWSWTELDLIDETAGGATRAQRDALKLLAAFIQHTDTKPEQQRMVCLDASPACERPFMMLDDVGLTFGRANVANANAIGSVNLEQWASAPVWKDADGCIANLPKSFTGTLKDPAISEEGRRFLARLLLRFSLAQRRDLFEAARVDLRGATSPEADSKAAHIDEWIEVFNRKEAEIAGRRCVEPWSGGVPVAFQVDPVLWVQSWASPALTRLMNGVSLLGYAPACIALAVFLAFGFRLRAGASLLLLIALTAALTQATKIIVSFPRPDVVDARVQSLGLFQQTRDDDSEPDGIVDFSDTFGFPSGHVATTTAFLMGVTWLFRWRWAGMAMLVWIPLMALSRVYLGRHFLGDVLGGVAIATIATAIALLWWRLPRLERPARGWRVARRALYTGAGLAVLALVAGIPPAYESGRLVGFSIGALLIARESAPYDDAPIVVRVRRIALASLLYTVAWWGTAEVVNVLAGSNAPVAALMAGALPATILLPGPLYIERWYARQKVSI